MMAFHRINAVVPLSADGRRRPSRLMRRYAAIVRTTAEAKAIVP
jgi:hypothetical protein